MIPKDVIELAKQNNVQVVDLKFNDLPGLWQHFSISLNEFDEGLFEGGIGFDGSSIRGFQKIQESDMLLFPDPETAVVDPVCKVPTLSLICDVFDPLSKQPYTRDPRYIAQKAEDYLKKSGIGDTVYFGPELEFFLFNDVRFDSNQNESYYFIDSREGDWNTGKAENPKPRIQDPL